MDKILLENLLNKFIEYLKEIGLLTKFDILNFKNIFYSIHNSNRYLDKYDNNLNKYKINKLNLILENLSKKIPEAILSFFEYISLQNKKSIAINIYEKYANKKENIKKNKMLNLLFIYYNKKIRYYLFQWKLNKRNYLNKYYLDENLCGLNRINKSQNIFNLKNIHSLKNNRNKNNNIFSNSDYLHHFNILKEYQEVNNNNKGIYHKDLYNTFKNTLSNNNSNKLLSSEDSKCQDKNIIIIKKNKTLKNKIEKNKYFRNNPKSSYNEKISTLYETPKFSVKTKDNCCCESNNNVKIFENSYKNNKSKLNNNNVKYNNYTVYDSNQMTFKPKLFSYIFKDKNGGVNKIKNENHEKRIKKFNKKKEENILKLSKDLEEEFNKKYTFTPQINKSKNKNYSEPKNNSLIPRYEKLYQDNKIRKEKLKKKIQKSFEEIDNKANMFLLKYGYNDDNYYYTYKNDNLNNNINDNNKRNKSGYYNKRNEVFEDLYNDYKKKENNINSLKIDFDKEAGITFSPILYSNGKYFDKINQNFFEREKELLLKHQIKNQKYNEKYRNKKKYSKEEKEVIFKDIEERLYKEGLDKYIYKNNVKKII